MNQTQKSHSMSTTQHSANPFLSLKEVASYLKCSVKTVRRLIDDRKLVAGRLRPRGRLFVMDGNLKRFINQLPEEH